MKKYLAHLLIFTAVAVLGVSCDKEDDEPEENENEVLTTIEVQAVEQGSSLAQVFTWLDADGDGGNAPVIEDISLQAGKVYNVRIRFLNETTSPAEDMTEEVQEESEVHRLYYEPSAGSGIAVSGLDNDGAGKPLGLSSVWTTTGTGSGTMTITLRHYAGGGKEASDPVNSGKSSTDGLAFFNVVVNP